MFKNTLFLVIIFEQSVAGFKVILICFTVVLAIALALYVKVLSLCLRETPPLRDGYTLLHRARFTRTLVCVVFGLIEVLDHCPFEGPDRPWKSAPQIGTHSMKMYAKFSIYLARKCKWFMVVIMRKNDEKMINTLEAGMPNVIRDKSIDNPVGEVIGFFVSGWAITTYLIIRLLLQCFIFTLAQGVKWIWNKVWNAPGALLIYCIMFGVQAYLTITMFVILIPSYVYFNRGVFSLLVNEMMSADARLANIKSILYENSEFLLISTSVLLVALIGAAIMTRRGKK